MASSVGLAYAADEENASAEASPLIEHLLSLSSHRVELTHISHWVSTHTRVHALIHTLLG
jgi:hypothetical protein